MIMFGLYLAVLYVVVLANKDNKSIYSDQEMKSMIVFADHHHTVSLDDVINVKRYISAKTGLAPFKAFDYRLKKGPLSRNLQEIQY